MSNTLECIVVMFRQEQAALRRQVDPRTTKVVVIGDNVYGYRFSSIDRSRVNTDIMSGKEYERYDRWDREHLAGRLRQVEVSDE